MSYACEDCTHVRLARITLNNTSGLVCNKHKTPVVRHGNCSSFSSFSQASDEDTEPGTRQHDFYPPSSEEEPKDNQGRETCFWCKTKTKKVDSGFAFYDICPRCKK